MMGLDEALYKFSQHAATVLGSIDRSWDSALRVLNQNNNGLLCLKEAVQNFANVTPYSAEVEVMSPSGFLMKFKIQHATKDGFIEAFAGLMAFLKTDGFQPWKM